MSDICLIVSCLQSKTINLQKEMEADQVETRLVIQQVGELRKGFYILTLSH